ncbi:hypothetical protein [Rhizobium tubonense]|uniref:Uncharacterized protein n=1 Tax=Rhizobium tubonense TaxID=484088 RepID=A0A2W4C9G0_9HYPH|nr:hypothetical protein [Rhizobium tubonense]PZM10032.1 hypothetical protein CPY51_24010 [Rhizobium tubonense]
MTYDVIQIGPAEVDHAFLLIEPVSSHLGLTAWRDFCSQLDRRASNAPHLEQVWIAVNPLGRTQGLALSKLGDDPAYGRTLDVPIFVVASAADESGVSGALIVKLGRVAEERECRSIRFWTVGRDSWSRCMQASDYQRWNHGVRMMLS